MMMKWACMGYYQESKEGQATILGSLVLCQALEQDLSLVKAAFQEPEVPAIKNNLQSKSGI